VGDGGAGAGGFDGGVEAFGGAADFAGAAGAMVGFFREKS
jgi:hypothetical protein